MSNQKEQPSENIQSPSAAPSNHSDPIGADFLICPRCHAFTESKDNWWPAADLYTGLVFGFWIICDSCKKKSYINLLQIGKPPLFDLSKHYTFKSSIDE